MNPTEQLTTVVNTMADDFIQNIFAAMPAIFKMFVIVIAIGLVVSLILFILKGFSR